MALLKPVATVPAYNGPELADTPKILTVLPLVPGATAVAVNDMLATGDTVYVFARVLFIRLGPVVRPSVTPA